MNTLKIPLTRDLQIEKANEAIRFIITHQKKLGTNQIRMSEKLQLAHTLISEIRHKRKSIASISFNEIKSRLITEFQVCSEWIDYGILPIIKGIASVEEEKEDIELLKKENARLKETIESQKEQIVHYNKIVELLQIEIKTITSINELKKEK